MYLDEIELAMDVGLDHSIVIDVREVIEAPGNLRTVTIHQGNSVTIEFERCEDYATGWATPPPSSRAGPKLLVPGAEAGASYRFPSKNDSLPAPGELSIRGEDGHELGDGQLVYAAPAGRAHAEIHAALSALLVAFVKPSHKVYVDMLTNLGTVPKNELAAHISMVVHYEQEAPRPLEDVVEICSTQPLTYAERKLRKFASRGVRKRWCVQLSKSAVWEWDRSIDGCCGFYPAMAIWKTRCWCAHFL
jgi:Uma2 family endonuclease